MKDLLEKYFGQHYHSTKHALTDSEIKKGRFSFADSKACDDCKRFTPAHEVDCDKAVVNIDSRDRDVVCIQLERFMDHYTNLKAIPSGKKCDLMIVDEGKIVFCDMTCSKAKYIGPYMMQDGTEKIGKRNTVRKQIENSISLLMDVPEIASKIKEKPSRIALFAFRVKDVTNGDDFDSKVKIGMQAFGIKPDKLAKEPMFSDMGNGFLFTEVKYPETFVW